jgi:hypothetical protein
LPTGTNSFVVPAMENPIAIGRSPDGSTDRSE